MNLAATDSLGRKLASHEEAGDLKADRIVGMFYYLWLGEHGTTGPWDITKILRDNPNAMSRPTSPPWGPPEVFHHWGEPLYGYYLSNDEWVLRRHMQMMIDARIDVLFFDVTNNYTYKPVYMMVLAILHDLLEQGFAAPSIVFYCRPGTGGGQSLQEVYRDLYKPELFSELWFRWEDKPLIVANPETADSDEIRGFFTFRIPIWHNPKAPCEWPWCQEHPQVCALDTRGGKEAISVSVSVPELSMSEGAYGEPVQGRSWHGGARDARSNAVLYGLCLEEQCKRALAEDPPLVLVTQFNEWIAQRFGREAFEQKHDILFRDEFDIEYSRDIEPMKGGFGDNYYMQICDFVRRYKGIPAPLVADHSWTIAIDGSMEQWAPVAPEYREYLGDIKPRYHAGYDGAGRYVNRTGRNEFQLLKVTADADTVFFYAETVKPLTPRTGRNWMLLFIDSDGNSSTGWEGFNYVVNRRALDAGTVTLEESEGGWNWRDAGVVRFRSEGNRMHLAVPRKALGVPGDGPVSLQFKWSDNMQTEGDVMDFYVNGDAAPRGRFRHLFTATGSRVRAPGKDQQ